MTTFICIFFVVSTTDWRTVGLARKPQGDLSKSLWILRFVSITLQGTNIYDIPYKGTLQDDFPFPKVGYVRTGMPKLHCFTTKFYSRSKSDLQHLRLKPWRRLVLGGNDAVAYGAATIGGGAGFFPHGVHGCRGGLPCDAVNF